MTTNKDDLRALKRKHRLELVMIEAGERLEAAANDENILVSKSTPGLTVDVYRQIYEVKQPGKIDTGDVYAWLKRRYSWSFGMAVRFLKSRPSDPEQPRKVPSKSKKKSAVQVEQLFENNSLDQWQEQALELAGENIRNYFSWSFWDLVLYADEIRIDPSIAPDITTCQRCDKRIEWKLELGKSLVQIPAVQGFQLKHIGQLPVIAYSIKRRVKTSDFGLKGNGEIESAFNDLIDLLGEIFVEEEDGVICEECAWKEYKFQIALSLCKKSARVREKAEDERRHAILRDALIIERQERELEESRLPGEWENASDRAAGRERTEPL